MNEILQQRVLKLRRLLRSQSLDAMIILDRVNTYYFTGFRCTYSILVIDTRRKPVFITDSRYGEMAEKGLDGFDLRIQPATQIIPWLKAFWKARDYSTAGFEGTISVDDFTGLKKWAGRTKLVKAGDLPLSLRRVKDNAEIRLIRKAVVMGDLLMGLAASSARVGMSELELSKIVRRGAEDLGGTGESFDNIIAAGPNTSRPHHHPSARRMRAGDPLTVDLGVIREGYCSDMTRAFNLGKPSAEFEKIYEVCLEANLAATKAVRPGMNGREVDAEAREVIETAGYGKYFGHGLGHGVGLEIHEAPRLSPNAGDYKLEAGNIITIEPGIYLPGVGGVRIEDYVLLTDKGAQVLSRYPRALQILGRK